MSDKLFPYLVAVNMEHQSGIDTTEELIAPWSFTAPSLYCPPITVIVHGIEDPSSFDMNDETMTFDKLIEQGLAMPLLGFRGHVLLQHALGLQDIDPRNYFVQDFPEHAKIPEAIIGVPTYEDVDCLEDCPNVLVLEDFDIFTDAGIQHLDYILDRLNTLVLASCSIPVNVVVYPTPKLTEIINHPLLADNPSLRGYFESFYDEDEAKLQDEPKILNMADYLRLSNEDSEGKSPAFEKEGKEASPKEARDSEEVVTLFPGRATMEMSERSVHDEILGLDLILVLDLMDVIKLDDIDVIQEKVASALDEARLEQGELDLATAGEITIRIIRGLVQDSPGIDREALEEILSQYQERIDNRLVPKQDAFASGYSARDEHQGATDGGEGEAGPREGNDAEVDEASLLAYHVFLTIHFVLNGFVRCLPMDADYLFRDYDTMDYDDAGDFDTDEW